MCYVKAFFAISRPCFKKKLQVLRKFLFFHSLHKLICIHIYSWNFCTNIIRFKSFLKNFFSKASHNKKIYILQKCLIRLVVKLEVKKGKRPTIWNGSNIYISEVYDQSLKYYYGCVILVHEFSNRLTVWTSVFYLKFEFDWFFLVTGQIGPVSWNRRQVVWSNRLG
jgi:hypothetical protein